MKGIINIFGLIGETDEGVGVTLLDIITQVKAQPQATSFDVVINSRGGDVFEGWKIANYIKSLSNTNAIGREVVASIATVIFGSCTTRTREPNSKFMMHLPMGDMGGGGTADEIEAFGKKVREEEDKLCKFYSELMGFDKDTIKSLISSDTYLTDEQTKALGITTIEPLKIVAKAYLNLNIDNKMGENENKSFLEALNSGIDKILAKLSGGKTITNVMLQDANGVTIDFPEVAEGEQVAVDAMATIDGAPAEGEYIMPTGQTYVFVGGKLTEIKEAEGGEDVEALKTELAGLKTQLAEQVQAVAEKETLILAMAKEVSTFRAQIVSKMPTVDGTDPKKKEEGTTRKFLKD